MQKKGKKIALVAGATGLVGRQILRLLAEDDRASSQGLLTSARGFLFLLASDQVLWQNRGRTTALRLNRAPGVPFYEKIYA